MLRQIRRLWRNTRSAADIDTDFDPEFYFGHNPDLQHLHTPEQLWLHYKRHGHMEGRPKNPNEALRALEALHDLLPADFSPAAYRLLNEDLSRGNFVHDHHFIRHFLEHGRREGRPYRFERLEGESGVALERLLSGVWPSLFRTAEFAAMAQSWLPRQPASRAEALQLFATLGVERLAPISFAHIFDPGFYRQAYDRSSEESDSALYRDWLLDGMAAGRAPNEKVLLRPYLGSCDVPADFDWGTYRSQLSGQESASIRNRADALMHFFERGFADGVTPGNAGTFDLFSALGDFHFHRGRLLLATRAYDLAERVDPARVNGSLLYRRGLARKAEAPLAALADFLAGLDGDEGPWEGVAEAIAILIDERVFDRAFSVLDQARARWRRRPEYLVCLRRVMQACYEDGRATALQFYATQERQRGDEAMTDALRRIVARMETLEALPARFGPQVDGPVLLLANQDLPQCRHYRIEQKLRQFRHIGLAAQAFGESEVDDFITALLTARAAIFYRVAATPEVLRAILYARALGIPTYYELDDLLFDADHFPDNLASYEGQISEADYRGLQLGVPLYRFAMSLCGTAIASTPSLARRMEPWVTSRRALLLRNGLDERNAAAIDRAPHRGEAGETITLFYGTGTKAHSGDFTRDLGPALLALLDRQAHLRLVIAGYLHLGPEFDRHASRIVQLGFVADLDAYWSLLSACDINLAVLPSGPLADCKSEIKWLEAAIFGVPSVVSATATYREALLDGVDVILVEQAGDWYPALDKLVGDAALRRRIGEAARCKALAQYSLDAGSQVLGLEFEPPARAVELANIGSRRLKVLICNIFFAPQSYGGATRVVEDNVDYLIDHCPDIEVSIFSVDEGREPFGHLRCDSYRGRPVFRISEPSEKLRDWQPFKADNHEQFQVLLGRLKPDIVHFHCVQRLTASIVEATLQAGIPYIVTLHDGWWISDSQSFMDRDGILHLPSADPFDVRPPLGVSLAEAVARRRALARLLHGACRVLSVSEPFAEIYRTAGIDNVVTVENGVSALRPQQHQARADRRLSLGHLGGRSTHKGATLVEAAFRLGHYERLALTMIDNEMSPADRAHTQWGATPVLLRGPCPPEQVAGLYAELDVLLAPSIWPESFGLVAREAACLGVHVVASNRGAMGQGVLSGENGTIIDVDDIGSLARLLGDMNAEPQKWQAQAPHPQAVRRTADDQGVDLARLYRACLKATP